MKRILPTIVIAQLCCTSLWFAGNAVVGDIGKKYQLDSSFIAHLTSGVQFGFIIGTLIFAILSISDRFSPSKVFFVCAITAAAVNLLLCLSGLTPFELLIIRFFTGFFLAGIYPVGMKIAADYFDKDLSKSLGFLVGALVLGTALPHLLKGIATVPWTYVIFSTATLSCLGGLAMLVLVPDGPHRKSGQQFTWTAFLSGFKEQNFRSTAIGYFGHNWELYAFWVFLPVMLSNYEKHYPKTTLNVPLLSFLIISSGGLACVVSGIIAKHFGAKRTAVAALSVSGICCLISPLLLLNSSFTVFLIFLFIWGMSVVADSPLFSTLIAKSAVPAFKGTSLTVVNCFGFALTIVSIQLINAVQTPENATYVYLLLGIGPIIGLVALLKS